MVKADNHIDDGIFCKMYKNGVYVCDTHKVRASIMAAKKHYRHNCDRNSDDVVYLTFNDKLVFWREHGQDYVLRNFDNLPKGETLINKDGLIGASLIEFYEGRRRKLEEQAKES
jgi:hypothetical protein